MHIDLGEESNFVWSVFYSLLEQVIDVLNVADPDEGETDKLNNLKYVFIDDPVSSLDDNHLIELAVNLAQLIKLCQSELKFIITTHNPLFYNVLYNELNRNDKHYNYKANKHFVKYRLEKFENGTFSLLNQSNISISKLKSGSTEMIQVPVYNSVSAGPGLEPSPEPVDVLLLPKSVAEGCVIINVWGDSMEPTIKDGYAVMVKREVEVANNDIGIFIHEGEALVKRYKCFDGKCYLYSDNQSYPPREIRKNDEFKVCGKVIWIIEKA